MHRLACKLLAAALFAGASPAVSACVITAVVEGQTPARELVEQLGSPRFVERQQAQQMLEEMGPAALQALQEGTQAEDAEVRQRCQELLQHVERAARRVALDQFLAGQEPELPLPGWEAFAEIVGDTTASRAVFARMLQSEWEFLEFVLSSPQNAASAIEYRTDQIRQHPERETGSEAFFAVFFVTLQSPQLPDRLMASVGLLHRDTTFYQAMLRGAGRPVLRKLMGHWIRTADTGDLARLYAMTIGMEFGLEEVLEPARQTLTNTRTLAPYLALACTVVARHGDASDIAALEGLFGDERQVDQDSVVLPGESQQPQRIQIQVRDLALFAAVTLEGRDPDEYGFAGNRHLRRSGFYRIGFPSDETRNAAFSKWKSREPARDADPNGL